MTLLVMQFTIKMFHILTRYWLKAPWWWHDSVETCRSAIICEIIVRLLVVVQNNFFGATAPQWAMASSFTRFLDHIQLRTTVGRTPLDEWSARRRDLYLTTHNTHNRKTSMPPGGIRTHNLRRRAATDLRLRPRGHWDRHKQCNNS